MVKRRVRTLAGKFDDKESFVLVSACDESKNCFCCPKDKCFWIEDLPGPKLEIQKPKGKLDDLREKAKSGIEDIKRELKKTREDINKQFDEVTNFEGIDGYGITTECVL